MYDANLPVTLTDDNAADLCTCGHDRGWHWDGTGQCGERNCCGSFAYDALAKAGNPLAGLISAFDAEADRMRLTMGDQR